LKAYFDGYKEEGTEMDDDDDDEAYEIEEGELQYEPVELDGEKVDIDYKFCPDGLAIVTH
jgi:hypothetical protein